MEIIPPLLVLREERLTHCPVVLLQDDKTSKTQQDKFIPTNNPPSPSLRRVLRQWRYLQAGLIL